MERFGGETGSGQREEGFVQIYVQYCNTVIASRDGSAVPAHFVTTVMSAMLLASVRTDSTFDDIPVMYTVSSKSRRLAI
jgi:hypothetical protein